MKTFIIFEEDGIAMEIGNAMLLKSLIGRRISKVDNTESLTEQKVVITLEKEDK